MKEVLKIVPESAPYDEVKGLRKIEKLREELLAAAVQFAKEGRSGHVSQRLRDASDASGIPRVFIESMMRK